MVTGCERPDRAPARAMKIFSLVSQQTLAVEQFETLPSPRDWVFCYCSVSRHSCLEERKPSEMFRVLHDGIGGTAELGWRGRI